MSVVASSPRGWVVSHKDHLDKTFLDKGWRSRGGMFEIATPFRMDGEAEKAARQIREGGVGATEDGEEPTKKKKKRKRSNDEGISSKFRREKDLCRRFLEDLHSNGCWPFRPPVTDPDVVARNNRPARELARRLEEEWLTTEHNPSDLILPEEAESFQATLEKGKEREILNRLFGAERRFDVALLDPPWENKHVRRERRRGRGYETVEAFDDFSGLVVALAEKLEERGLVVLWCTPSERARRAAENMLEEAGLQVVARWLWLKVTQSGEPVVPLDHPHKVPFEFVYVARKREPFASEAKLSEKIVCSVPSAFQSHKPPLDKVLEDECPGKCSVPGKCLEVFGRYLLPGWATVGDQCCKFQHKMFFEETSKWTVEKSTFRRFHVVGGASGGWR